MHNHHPVEEILRSEPSDFDSIAGPAIYHDAFRPSLVAGPGPMRVIEPQGHHAAP
jgi:hypothetical protein